MNIEYVFNFFNFYSTISTRLVPRYYCYCVSKPTGPGVIYVLTSSLDVCKFIIYYTYNSASENVILKT